MSDEEENVSVDALAIELLHLGTSDIPINAPVLCLPLQEVEDDFYHNPLDWSSQNIVAYVDEHDVSIVVPSSDSPVTRQITNTRSAVSVKFSCDSRFLAIGTNSGVLEVYDVETNQKVWQILSHKCRISCLTWDNDLIFTGSRDRCINVNVPNSKASMQIGSHAQEVCGIKVSPTHAKLVTGGNDNLVKVWDLTKLNIGQPFAEIQEEVFPNHKSAIKAIDFSPCDEGVIATGGGCNDGKILVWNVDNLEIFKEIEIDKQITNLSWLESGKEILATYGFGWNRNHKFNIEHNFIDIWSFETQKVVQRFEGHKGRVLFSSMAPNKEGFVTAASDNMLKFWKPTPNEW